MDTIFQLCRKYTVLSDPEIEQICRISAFLQPHRRPHRRRYFYRLPLPRTRRDRRRGGKAVRRPLLLSGYCGRHACKGGKRACGRTLFAAGHRDKADESGHAENSCTIQSVVPIKHEGRVIGVLIQERRTENQPPTEVRTEYGRAAPSAPPADDRSSAASSIGCRRRSTRRC